MIKEWFKTDLGVLYQGHILDVLENFPNESIDCIITSPPYWRLSDFGKDTEVKWPSGWYGQLGWEPILDLYIEHLLYIMKELKRVLKKMGVIFWIHGDYYKDGLYLINYRFASYCIDKFGLILKNIIVVYKQKGITMENNLSNNHEPIFIFAKDKNHWFNPNEITSNVWTIPFATSLENYFQFFKEKIIKPMIEIGCPESGIILDPFMGGGSVAIVAEELNRKWIGIEIKEQYCKLIEQLLRKN